MVKKNTKKCRVKSFLSFLYPIWLLLSPITVVHFLGLLLWLYMEIGLYVFVFLQKVIQYKCSSPGFFNWTMCLGELSISSIQRSFSFLFCHSTVIHCWIETCHNLFNQSLCMDICMFFQYYLSNNGKRLTLQMSHFSLFRGCVVFLLSGMTQFT